jgi:hypothetical protein
MFCNAEFFSNTDGADPVEPIETLSTFQTFPEGTEIAMVALEATSMCFTWVKVNPVCALVIANKTINPMHKAIFMILLVFIYLFFKSFFKKGIYLKYIFKQLNNAFNGHFLNFKTAHFDPLIY